MFKSILVAVDGSDSNNVAVNTAIAMAKEQGAKLTALSVFDPGGYGNMMAVTEATNEIDYMHQVCGNCLTYVNNQAKGAGIEYEAKIVAGNPAEKIVEESKNHDLVICGTLGRTGLSRLVMGSVAEKVVTLSECPVLVCRK